VTRTKLRRLLRFIFFRERDASRAANFWRRFPSGVAVVILATVINGICHRLGMFEKWEWTDSDKLLRNASTESPSTRVVLILISDDDYRSELFHNQSPLPAAPILDLVSAVCRFHPKAVGVDILTGEWSPNEMERAKRRFVDLTASNCHVIWIRDAEENSHSAAEESQDNSYFRLGRVVGNDGPPHGVCTALPVFVPDSDGIIRRYTNQVAASPPGEVRLGQYVTLPRALTSPGDCGFLNSSDQSSATSQKIRFTGNSQMLRLPARQVIDTLDESFGSFRDQLQSRVRDSIVIVGGSYRYARDRYLTPIGPLLGAEIIGDAVQTVNDPIRDVSLLRLLAVEFGVEVLLLALVTVLNLRLPWALALSGLFAILAAFGISWFLFHYAGYFLGVFGATVGVVLGTLGEVVYEPIREDLKQWSEQLCTFLASEKGIK
jgi:CHASE2 domain-containing sensor protein